MDALKRMYGAGGGGNRDVEMQDNKHKVIVAGKGLTGGESAEKDRQGKEILDDKDWKKMSDADRQGGEDPGTNNGYIAKQVDKLFTTLYGKLPAELRERILWLASTFFFIIGGYWLLRSLKDPIISTIVGVEYIPKAKMLSLVVVFAMLFIYNKLVDMLEKHQLFYVVGGFYALVFAIISFLLAHPTIGLANTEADPARLLGWVSYLAIESFGSIGVSLFWQFTNSTITLEGAKSAFGLIIAGGQIGSILGPSVAAYAAPVMGVPQLYSLGTFCLLMMVVMVYFYTKKFGPCQTDAKKKKANMMEGLQLMAKYGYIRGILALSCLFMVEVTILDYTMKVLAKNYFDTAAHGDLSESLGRFAQFMGVFGQCTNGISFIFSLLGTSYVIRALGLRWTLLAFPTLCLGAIGLVWVYPKLYIVFLAMMALKAFSYALNNPCKEMLYQPTSIAVKFKSKSWIDIFGARGSKALGSVITNAFTGSMDGLVQYGGLVAMGISGFLIWVAYYMGIKFDLYIAEDYVVGSEEEEAEALAEMAANGETEDNSTTCALDDDDDEEGGNGGNGVGGEDGDGGVEEGKV